MEPSLEQRIVDVFALREGVVAVYVFGSWARGTAKPDSDVDVAVLCTSSPPQRLDGPRLVLEGEFERALGRTVDLVVLNDGPSICASGCCVTVASSSTAIAPCPRRQEAGARRDVLLGTPPLGETRG